MPGKPGNKLEMELNKVIGPNFFLLPPFFHDWLHHKAGFSHGGKMAVVVLDITTSFYTTERQPAFMCLRMSSKDLSFGLIKSPWTNTYGFRNTMLWVGVGPRLSTWLLPSGGGAGLRLERQSHYLPDPAILSPLMGTCPMHHALNHSPLPDTGLFWPCLPGMR